MKKFAPFIMMLAIVAVSAYIFNCCGDPETVEEINADSTKTYADYSELVLSSANEFYDKAELDKAINILQTAYDVADNRPKHNPEDFVKVAVMLGKTYNTKAFITNKDIGKAVSVLDKAVSAADTLGNEKLLADALHTKGTALYTRIFLTGEGDYNEPLNMVGRALSIRSSIGDKEGEAESLIYYGILNERMGNKDNAFELYHRALAITEENEMPKLKAQAMRHIGFMLRAKGSKFNRSALDYFRRSLALREKEGVTVYLPFSYISVGELLFAENQPDSALTYYMKAEKLAEEMNADRILVLTSWLKGDLAIARRDTSLAKQHYNNALTTAENIGYTRGTDLLKKTLEGIE